MLTRGAEFSHRSASRCCPDMVMEAAELAAGPWDELLFDSASAEHVCVCEVGGA